MSEKLDFNDQQSKTEQLDSKLDKVDLLRSDSPMSYLDDDTLNVITSMKSEFSPELPRQRYLEMRQKFSVDWHDYPIIGQQVGKNGVVDEYFDLDSLMTKYVTSTKNLIMQMDGRFENHYVNNSGEMAESGKPDDVIYLDKSARPVEWFVRKFWDAMSNPTTQPPTAHFANIDRADWLRSQPQNAGRPINELSYNDFNKRLVSREEIARIRSIFVDGELTPENWQERVWQLPTVLDNRNVMIVDEVSSTGATVHIARDLIQLACPEAFVGMAVFWDPGRKNINKGGEVKFQMGLPPVWYDSQRITGRGVGDKSEVYYDSEYQKNPNSKTFKAKLGSIALSAPLLDDNNRPIRDRLAVNLLKEIKRMKRDYTNGRILEGVMSGGFDDRDDDVIFDELERFTDQHQMTITEHRRYRELRAIEAKKSCAYQY